MRSVEHFVCHLLATVIDSVGQWELQGGSLTMCSCGSHVFVFFSLSLRERVMPI